MKVVLTSTNPAKIEATKHTLQVLYPEMELETIEIPSGVSETPTDENEGIKGCMNRIAEAKKRIPDADFYIALEGIIASNNYGMYLSGWCAIDEPKKDRTSFGSSAKVRIPDFIAVRVRADQKLSELVKEYYPSDLVENMPLLGTNGIITEGKYTRVKEFEDALITTIGYLENEKNFSE